MGLSVLLWFSLLYIFLQGKFRNLFRVRMGVLMEKFVLMGAGHGAGSGGYEDTLAHRLPSLSAFS